MIAHEQCGRDKRDKKQRAHYGWELWGKKQMTNGRRRRRHAGSKAHERGVARAQVRAEDMHYSDVGLIGFGSTSESLACLGGGKRGEEEE